MLEQTGSVRIDVLTKALYASDATIRRDLSRLEAEGLIIRAHGKAVSINLYADKCVPYGVREATGIDAKRRIAEAAVREQVKEGSVVMLDASSTALQTVEHLARINDLIVITSGISTLVELMKTNLRFYSTGGRAINESSSFVGQTALNAIDTFNADVCFVSCHGLGTSGFVTDTSERENDVRAAMLKRSKRRVLLLDGTKLGEDCWHNLCHVSEFDEVYCNAPLPPELLGTVKSFHLVP